MALLAIAYATLPCYGGEKVEGGYVYDGRIRLVRPVVWAAVCHPRLSPCKTSQPRGVAVGRALLPVPVFCHHHSMPGRVAAEGN